MTYEELKISLDLNGYKNVLPIVGRSLNDSHWFIVCDDGDCHLFDRHGNEDDIKKVKNINEYMISWNIKNIVIPNCVTSIGEWTFVGCSDLKSVTISDSVTSIGWWAFSGCSSLTSVTIGNGMTSIEWGAFEGCSGLTSMTIDKPIEQVKSMKHYPFGIEDESIIKCN